MLPGTKPQRKSTFALAEIVLSVAVLTVLAGFTVHMLICAKNNNAKSYDLYKGMSHAINVIEAIKGVPHPEVLSEEDFEPGAVLSGNENGFVLSMYFDKTWAPIPSTGSQPQPCYSVKAEVMPSETAAKYADSSNQTYDIKVCVLRLMPYVLEKHKQSEILVIETLKCYMAFAIPEGMMQ